MDDVAKNDSNYHFSVLYEEYKSKWISTEQKQLKLELEQDRAAAANVTAATAAANSAPTPANTK